MEHRHQRRHPIELDIDIHHGHYLGRFKTRNVSHSGLFVETAWLELPRLRLVDLYVHAGADSHWLQAMVMHVSAQGVGLARVDSDPKFVRHLSELLRSQGLPRPMEPERSPTPGLHLHA